MSLREGAAAARVVSPPDRSAIARRESHGKAERLLEAFFIASATRRVGLVHALLPGRRPQGKGMEGTLALGGVSGGGPTGGTSTSVGSRY